MKRSYVCFGLILFIGIACLVLPIFPSCPLNSLVNWGLIAPILITLAVLAFFFKFEAAAITSKEIVLVSMLGTMSAILRVPFGAIPSVQPSTYLIICSGYVFGPIAGFTVGAITPLISNFFLSHGPWTLYQMFAWGMIGVIAAYLGRFNLNTKGLVLFGIIAGYIFGVIMNVWFWTSFVYPLTLKTFVVAELNSIWFDTLHAIGNAIFMGFFGMKTIAILQRFKRKFSWGLLPP